MTLIRTRPSTSSSSSNPAADRRAAAETTTVSVGGEAAVVFDGVFTKDELAVTLADLDVLEFAAMS